MRKFGQLKTILLIFSVALLLLIVAFAFNQNDSDELILSNESFTINQTPAILLENDNSSEMQNYSEIISNPEVEFSIKPIVQINNYKLNPKTEEYLSSVSDKKETNNYLVKFKNEIDNDKISKFSSKKEFSSDLVRLNGDAESIALLLNDSEVEYIELDQKTSILADNIPYGVSLTDAHLYWNITNGSGVKVAVLDTGIALHDDLMVFGGVSFVSSDYYDYNGHGTAVAGVLSAILNDNGLVGVAPSASIYSVKIMDDSFGSLSDAISAIEWCIDNNISIVSMSFGLDSYSQIFKEVLDDAYNSGILLVAAAGNNNGYVLYPAAYSSVIAVGAVDSSLQRASFSSYGNELELVAAGVEINSTSLNNEYVIGSGTSFSAPVVSGVAALIKSYNTSLTNEQLRAKLRNDALDLGSVGKDDYYGYGMVRFNLSSSDYDLDNESYFYEIFNITNYKTENESYVFWLNGTGTFEDVNFSEGYYLIKKYIQQLIQQKIYVDENGSINLLTYDVIFPYDSYSYYGTDYDGAVWTSGSLDFKCDGCSAQLVVCYNYDWNYPSGSFNRNECWSYDSTALTLCRSKFSDLNTTCNNAPSICHTSGIGDSHSYPSANLTTRHREWIKQEVYTNCGLSPNRVMDYDNIDVINRLRTSCYTSNQWMIQGKYSSSSWVDLDSFYNCISSKQCDSSVAGTVETTDKYYDFENNDNPCRTSDGYSCSVNSSCLTNHYCVHSYCRTNITYCGDGYCDSGESCSQDCQVTNLCNGTIEINENNGLQSLSVYLDNVYNGTTDIIGQKIIKIYNVECNSNQQEIKIKCSDNSTLCDIKNNQIDVNNDLDFLNFDCSICKTDNDIYLTQSDVYVNVETKKVTATIHSRGINSNILSVLYREDSEGIIEEVTSNISYISTNTLTNITFTLDNLDSKDYIHIYIDSNDSIKDEDNTNNYIFRAGMKNIRAYINVSLEPKFSILEGVIKEYIESFVEPVSNINNSDVILLIGHPSFSKSEPFSFGISFIEDESGKINEFYGGIVKSGPYFENAYSTSGKPYVLAYGNRIEGTIAAVKRLINARNIFLDKESYDNYYNSYIDKYDTLGLSVYDLMHNSEAEMHFYKNDDALKENVRKILFDNNFEVSVKPVKTLNTTSYGESTILRVKHVNSDFSQDYKDAIVNNSRPVVFAGGIFSHLESWEESNGLAKQLSQEGYDTWEIELTGGPYTDCAGFEEDTCPDYTYQDLVDYYWPASIAGIMEYSGKNQVDYVGHSNGGRVGLSSLNSYSQGGKDNAGYYFDYNTGTYEYADLSSNPVNTFVGVAVPGTLNNNSVLTEVARYLYLGVVPAGMMSVASIDLLGLKHVRMFDYASPFLLFTPTNWALDIIWIQSIFQQHKISRNLMNGFNNLAIEDNSTFDLSNLQVNKLRLFNTNPHDLIVPFEDQQIILDAAKSVSDKRGYNYSFISAPFIVNHAWIYNNPNFKKEVKVILND